MTLYRSEEVEGTRIQNAASQTETVLCKGYAQEVSGHFCGLGGHWSKSQGRRMLVESHSRNAMPVACAPSLALQALRSGFLSVDWGV